MLFGLDMQYLREKMIECSEHFRVLAETTDFIIVDITQRALHFQQIIGNWFVFHSEI